MILILLAFAIVCAILAAFNVGAPRFSLLAASLAFYFIYVMILASHTAPPIFGK